MRFIEAKDIVAFYMAGANQTIVKKDDVDDFYRYLCGRFQEQNSVCPVMLYSDFYLKKMCQQTPKFFHISNGEIYCSRLTVNEEKNEIKQIVGQCPKAFKGPAIEYTKDYMKQHGINQPVKQIKIPKENDGAEAIRSDFAKIAVKLRDF